jgi:hypothetical protein
VELGDLAVARGDARKRNPGYRCRDGGVWFAVWYDSRVQRMRVEEETVEVTATAEVFF